MESAVNSQAYESIAFHAKANPGALAVQHGAVVETYERLIADVEDVCRELVELGLDGSTRVGLEQRMGYHHLVLLLATLRMGIPTASLIDGYLERMGTARMRELGFGAVVTWRPAPIAYPGLKTLSLPAKWRATRVSKATSPVPAPFQGTEPLRRVVFSSGTTGTPKGVPFDADTLERRLSDSVRWYDMSSSSRVMCMLDFTAGPGYWWPLATLAAGGLYVFPPATKAGESALFEFADTVGLTHLLTSPAILDRLLRTRARPLPALRRLESFGSHFPPALAQMARQRVTPNVFFQYGATEVGSVASARYRRQVAEAGSSGFVRADFRVEIVDDDGKALPPGATGRIRIWSRSLVKGYLGVDEPGGPLSGDWFHPGDIGSLSADGMLCVLGRSDELINIGGLKIAPHTLENHAREFPGVTDVAAFAVVNARGVPEAWIAVVSAGSIDPAAALEFVRRRAALPVTKVVQVARIPRNENGKILRRELSARGRQG